MSRSTPLADLFRKHTRARLKMPEDDALERSLVQAYEAARASWPDIALPPDQFTAHLAERLPLESNGEPPAVEQVLARVRLSDLYLACACLHGSRVAHDVLEREYLNRLPGVLSWHRVSSATIDDVCQEVRMKLLIPSTPGGEPHISTYRGDGDLFGWVKTIATRIANKKHWKENVNQVASSILEELGGKQNLERDAIKQDLLEKVRRAVNDAVPVATSKEHRQLLRLYYADGLSTPEIAKLRGMAQATVWRRLEAARQGIHDQAIELLRERHGWSGDDLKGFFGNVQSRLDLTLSQLFAPSSRLSSKG